MCNDVELNQLMETLLIISDTNYSILKKPDELWF